MNPFTWAVLIVGYAGGVYILVANRESITLLYIILLICMIVITLIGLYVVFLEWQRRHAISNAPDQRKDGNATVAQEKVAREVSTQQEPPPKAEERYGEAGILAQISSDRTIRWVRDGVTVRTPGPSQSRSFQVNYEIGGRNYRYLTDLTARAVNEDRRLYQDIHGRYVLDMKERYPIFDSYDAVTENRYYHWYLILERDRMSMIYSDDGAGEEIVEDIEKLPGTPYRILQFWHYLDENGVLRLK